MAEHVTVNSSLDNLHWGYFDAALEPVVEVRSGDRVTLNCVSGAPDVMPTEGFEILPDLARLHRERKPRLPGHILTGPVAVADAEPGDVLEVRIVDVQLRQDWGYNAIRPLAGALPEDFHETRILHIPLDAEAMVAHLPWGVDLPLRPFFGVMGTAPPPGWGAVTSIIPRAFGGNLDNKELVPGTTLYLPVFNEGALFSAGDGHAVQGDGEVCVTAIETSLAGTFELVLRKDLDLAFPRAETASHYITMGMDPDLDDAAKQALRDMIRLIQERSNLTAEDAYTLCSLAADLRVTQIVNQHNGVHVMLAKSALHGEA
ncbi:MAG: acetamidase/formamidase family protein [Alphaproteobacteria bacterium]|jgi:acetamidase/formamidase|nr:acetamidase/formamidase family protein [Alphaproteobacteria bacterium]